MRIIQVINVRWFNATAWYGLELARLAKKAGHETLVVGLEGTEPLKRAEALGLATKALPLNAKSPLVWPGLYKNMKALVRAFRPDIVNCHRGEAFVLWSLLKKACAPAAPFALVRTRGDQRLPRPNGPNRFLHAHAADAVIATNSHMTRHFQTAMRVPAARLHTVLGGVDTQRFAFSATAREQIRAQYGYTEQDCVIGLLGRFDRVKGQKECIEAVAALVTKDLPVHVLLLGFASATSEEEIRAWIREAGMESRVRITGKVDDVAGHISALDVGAVCSLWSETIARAALEIMACARPLVSTHVGVMPDLLPTEALCPPGDVSALTHLLERAVTDVSWRNALRSINAQRLATLDSEHFWQETCTIYEAALQRAQGVT